MRPHPKDASLVLTSSVFNNNCQLMLWSIARSCQLIQFNETYDLITSISWSPKSNMFVAAFSNGYIKVYGSDPQASCKQTPTEQFFSTDYRNLVNSGYFFFILIISSKNT